MISQEHCEPTLWTILKRFGYEDVYDELKDDDLPGTRIHRLENILTLDASCRHLFDEMLLWFEEVDGKVRASPPAHDPRSG